MTTKFDTLAREILGEAQKNPYNISAVGGNVTWTRKGGNLEGAPKYVKGFFHCNSVELESLEGGPDVVEGDFYCYTNPLQTLKGSPRKVGGTFCCGDTLIENLEGAPNSVGGDLDCDSIKGLRSLKGCPQIIGGTLNCSSTSTKDFEGAPENVGGGVRCSSNVLVSLKGVPEANYYDFSDMFSTKGNFTEKDAKKEVERRKFEKGLDKETVETWGSFIDEI